jgi:hypothetical protein
MTDELEWIWKEAGVAKTSYYPGIFLEGLRNTTEIFSQDARCPSQDSS